MERGEAYMGLENRYEELSTLAQFFPSEEEIDWQVYDKPFVADVEILYVYGFSPHVKTLIAWLDADKKRDLVFLEDRVEVLKEIEEESVNLVLSHPQVHLRYDFGNMEIEEFVSEVIRSFPYEKIAVLSLHNNQKKFEEIEMLLYRKVTLECSIHTEMMYAHYLAKNLLKNFKRLACAFDFGAWKDQFKDVPAILCGAGPTLQEVYPELKKLEDKALILAGGSTITALSANGIKPHLIYAIDPNPEEFTRLAFHTAYDVPLLFGCRVEPNIFYSHSGPIGYFVTNTGGSLEEWMEKKLGIKDYEVLKGLGEEALSVTTAAFMTAIYLGCNPIILAGVDLAYKEGKRYTEGVISDLQCSLEEKPKKAGEAVWEKSGLATLTKWVMERKVLEDVCDLYPDRTFLKATRSGLEFKNIPFEPNVFSEIKHSIDLRSRIHELVMHSPLRVTPLDVESALDCFFTSMKNCKEIVSQIVLELKAFYPNLEGKEISQKNRIFEMDLEEEEAFQLALKQVVYALTFKLQKKYAPLNEMRNLYLIKLDLYSRLQAIIDEYLKMC